MKKGQRTIRVPGDVGQGCQASNENTEAEKALNNNKLTHFRQEGQVHSKYLWPRT